MGKLPAITMLLSTEAEARELYYYRNRLNVLTAQALDAEAAYIVQFDRANATAQELGEARGAYEAALRELGLALNKVLNKIHRQQQLEIEIRFNNTTANAAARKGKVAA